MNNNEKFLFYGFSSFFLSFFILFISYDFIKMVLFEFNFLFSNIDYKFFFLFFFSLLLSFGIGIIYFIFNLNVKNKKLNEVLNELKFQKQTLDEHAIVSMTDINGNITYVNDKFCQITQYTKDELIGQNHRIVKSDEHSKQFFNNLSNTIKSGNIWQGEIKNKTKNGDFYWVRATIVPFFDTNGNITRYVSARTDITQAKKVQQNILKAKIAVEQNNKAKSDFLANISHELKTPLNSIILLSNLMKKNKKFEENDLKNIEIINKCSKNLMELINDVLDISELDANKVKVICDDFNFNEFISNLISSFNKKLEHKNLSISVHIDENIKIVRNDKKILTNILKNIIDNAIKFSQKGEIKISAKLIGEKILMSIKDEGIGIAKNKLTEIFDRFKQIDSSTVRKYDGTGLGLALSKEFSNLINARIEVFSTENVGTTFIFEFDSFYKDNEKKVFMEEKSNNFSDNFEEIKISNNKNLINSNILILSDNPTELFNLVVNLKRISKKVIVINNLEELEEINKNSQFDKIIINYDDYKDSNFSIIDNLSQDIYLLSNELINNKDKLFNNVKMIIKKPIIFNDFLAVLES